VSVTVLVEFSLAEAEALLACNIGDPETVNAERKLAKAIAVETGETRDQVEMRLGLQALADAPEVG
jgi:hypothetical protein